MHSIRKVKMDCDVVSKCYANPLWMQHEHLGMVFDRINKPDTTFAYMVYLPQLKMLTRVNALECVDNYTFQRFVLTISAIDNVIRVGFAKNQ